MASLLLSFVCFAGCGDDDVATDTAPPTDTNTTDTSTPDDTSTADTSVPDTSTPEDTSIPRDTSTPDDTSTADTSAPDTSTADTSAPDTGAPGSCGTDSDCTFGEQWCVMGRCVECDNSGRVCRIDCRPWSTYTRNGCNPCACAPTSECENNGDCGRGSECVAGRFCTDWCEDGDPSCCWGNVCDAPGCVGENPSGCARRGCEMGQTCDTESECVSSTCSCSDGSYVCTRDCGGGVCVDD